MLLENMMWVITWSSQPKLVEKTILPGKELAKSVSAFTGSSPNSLCFIFSANSFISANFSGKSLLFKICLSTSLLFFNQYGCYLVQFFNLIRKITGQGFPEFGNLL